MDRVWAGVLTLTGFALSLVPVIHGGAWTCPGRSCFLRGLPGGALCERPRLGVLALLGLGLLAALGLGSPHRGKKPLRRARGGRGRCRRGRGLARGPGGTGAALPAGAGRRRVASSAAPGVVLELPVGHARRKRALSLSVDRHWQRMVNGSGSFDPPGSIGAGLLGPRWPSEFAAKRFRGSGIRYVVVHMEWIGTGQKARNLAASSPKECGSKRIHPERVDAIDPATSRGEGRAARGPQRKSPDG